MPKDEEDRAAGGGAEGSGGEDSDSSDEGSGSGPDGADSDDDEELILLLQARLQTCGERDYDAHVQLIKCLRDRGEIGKLEKARQAFARMFPLTEDMWLEWISDESRLAASDDDQAKIIGLFERGVADYCTPKLWEHYMGHCQKRYKEREESDPMKPKLLSEARAVAERALSDLGSHFSEGQRLWELQRAFELEVLDGQQDDDSAAVAAQRLRVRACFVSQILTPGALGRTAGQGSVRACVPACLQKQARCIRPCARASKTRTRMHAPSCFLRALRSFDHSPAAGHPA